MGPPAAYRFSSPKLGGLLRDYHRAPPFKQVWDTPGPNVCKLASGLKGKTEAMDSIYEQGKH